MRLSLLLAIAHVLCLIVECSGQGFVIRDNPQPSTFVIKEQVKTTPRSVRRKVVVYSWAFNQCPHCQALYNAVGNGDDEIEVEWVKSNHPRWFVNLGIAPVIYDPEQNVRYDGVLTMAELKRWANVRRSKTEITTVVTVPASPTTVCQCKGTDRGVCLCLKAGSQCHCTPTSGSVWSKTGQRVDTKTGEPAAGSEKPTMTPEKPQQTSGQYVWTQVCRWVQKGRKMVQRCSMEQQWRESK